MNISYYTIDDLRLPPKRSLRKGRSVEQYSTLEEALARRTTAAFPSGPRSQRPPMPLTSVSQPWACAIASKAM